MQAVLFTKLFKGLDLAEIVDRVAGIGFDGIDLLIRAGRQIDPTEPERIADTAALVQTSGLQVPMATTDLTDPDDPLTERLLTGCAEAGIRLIRLGYWPYNPAAGYASCLEMARRQLDGLEQLAEKTGVRLVLQLHGGTIHGSGAQAAASLAGHDPSHIGAYPDPGNQVVQDGREDWRFTFDILQPWLCCVGVKNGGWFPAERVESGQLRWRSGWTSVPDGMVPWDAIAAHLAASGYSGVLSFHSHYEDTPLPQALAQTFLDLSFIRRAFGGNVSRPLPAS